MLIDPHAPSISESSASQSLAVPQKLGQTSICKKVVIWVTAITLMGIGLGILIPGIQMVAGAVLLALGGLVLICAASQAFWACHQANVQKNNPSTLSDSALVNQDEQEQSVNDLVHLNSQPTTYPMYTKKPSGSLVDAFIKGIELSDVNVYKNYDAPDEMFSVEDVVRLFEYQKQFAILQKGAWIVHQGPQQALYISVFEGDEADKGVKIKQEMMQGENSIHTLIQDFGNNRFMPPYHRQLQINLAPIHIANYYKQMALHNGVMTDTVDLRTFDAGTNQGFIPGADDDLQEKAKLKKRLSELTHNSALVLIGNCAPGGGHLKSILRSLVAQKQDVGHRTHDEISAKEFADRLRDHASQLKGKADQVERLEIYVVADNGALHAGSKQSFAYQLCAELAKVNIFVIVYAVTPSTKPGETSISSKSFFYKDNKVNISTVDLPHIPLSIS